MLATGTREQRGLLAKLAAWWRQWGSGAAAIRELDQVGVDAEQIARDVGISPSELRVIAAKRPDAADLMRARAATLGIDLEALLRRRPQVVRDLERVCSVCGSKRICGHDLAEHPADPGWRAYCPNVQTLDAIAQGAGATARRTTPAEGVAEQPALEHCCPGQY